MANKLRSTVGLPFAIAGPYQDTGNFAILDTIYVLLEFKLCHSGQGIAEEEVARLGVLHTKGVQRPGQISGLPTGAGISHRYVLAASAQQSPAVSNGAADGTGRTMGRTKGVISPVFQAGWSNVTLMTANLKPSLKKP